MKKIKYILFIVLIIIQACDQMEFPSSQSDTFIKLYGTEKSDYGKDIKEYNGNYLLAVTQINEQDNKDIAIIKTDKLGNQTDIITIDKGGNDEVSEILLTNDGGFVVLGTTMDTLNNNENIYFAKYNSEFISVWENTYGGNYDQQGVAISKTGDGFILAGNTEDKGLNGNPEGVKDIYIVKVDVDGNELWSNSFGGVGEDYAADIITIDNGFLVIGTTNSYNEEGQSGSNIILIETNTIGIETDKITYGLTNDDEGKTILTTADGGYIISGTEENGSGSASIYVAKIEKDIHNVVWSKSFGSNNTDDIVNKLITSESDYVLIGSQINGSVETAIIKKIDALGEIIYEKSYGGYDTQNFYSITQTSDKAYAIIGSSGFEGNTQICLVKVNSEGEL